MTDVPALYRTPLVRNLASSCVAAASLAMCIRAAGASEPIIIESYHGARPADADSLLGPVVSELGRNGFMSPKAVAHAIDRSVSQPNVAIDDVHVTDVIRSIDTGYKKYVAGEFKAAADTIEPALSSLLRSPAALVGRLERRSAVMRGLIGLSLAHKRQGNPESAAAAMAELVRSFPDGEISYSDYGPEARELYQQVRKGLVARGPGSLSIDVDDGRAVVFLNERYVGVGDVTVTELIPGSYRVFVQLGGVSGRIHTANVESGKSSTLSLSCQLEVTLRTGARALLIFADGRARDALEARLALRIARVVSASNVVVLGIRSIRGQRSVVGVTFAADSTRPLHRAIVPLNPSPPRPAKLRALGRLLAGDENATSLLETAAVPIGPESQKDSHVAFLNTSQKAALAVGGLGLVGLGAGAVLGFRSDALRSDAKSLCPATTCVQANKANDLILQADKTALRASG